jgi:hypothetical protein
VHAEFVYGESVRGEVFLLFGTDFTNYNNFVPKFSNLNSHHDTHQGGNMFRILRLSLLLGLSITIWNGLAQAQASNHFPLQIGNQWIYKYQREDLNRNSIDSLITLSIIDSTSKYYRFNRYFLYYNTYGGDSSLFKTMNGKVIRKMNGKDMIWYDFSAKVGESWTIPVRDHKLFFPIDTVDIVAVLISKTDAFIWGQDTLKNCYRFKFSFSTKKIFDLLPWEEVFAPNVGLVEKISGYKYRVWDSYRLIKATIKNVRVSISTKENNNLNFPKRFFLAQNEPNPFRATTLLSYKLMGNSSAEVTAKIYNIMGQEINTLFAGFQRPGSYQIIWNGKNNFGEDVPAGIYLYSLTVDGYRETKKMIFQK